MMDCLSNWCDKVFWPFAGTHIQTGEEVGIKLVWLYLPLDFNVAYWKTHIFC
jgi:hypothetical protein